MAEKSLTSTRIPRRLPHYNAASTLHAGVLGPVVTAWLAARQAGGFHRGWVHDSLGRAYLRLSRLDKKRTRRL